MPDCGLKAAHKGVENNYVRPVATIGPTAIRLGIHVNAAFGIHQLKPLEGDLFKHGNCAATIDVAWQHNLARPAAAQLSDSAGGHLQVPD